MRLGTCPWAIDGAVHGRRTLAEQCAAAAAAGFSALEAPFSARLDRARPADGFAVPVTSVTVLASRRTALTLPEARRTALRTVEAMAEAARAVGASTVSLSPGPATASGGAARADSRAVESTVESLAEVCAEPLRRARAAGIEIVFENLPGHLLATRAAVRRLRDRLPDLRLCLDLANALADPPVEAWLDAFGTAIAKVHLSDGVMTPAGLEARAIGMGAVPYDRLRAGLRALAPSTQVFVEIPPRLGGGEPETEALARARRAAAECLGEGARGGSDRGREVAPCR